MMFGDKGIFVFFELDNFFKWVGIIYGVVGIVYEDLRYKFLLEFFSGYFYNVFIVKFFMFCYYFNVDIQGNICLDILKEKWFVLYDVRIILFFIQSFLGEFNIDSFLNIYVVEFWKNFIVFKKYL